MTQEELVQLRQFHDQDLAAGLEWVQDDESLNETGAFLAQIGEIQDLKDFNGIAFNKFQTEMLFRLARLGFMTLIDKRFADES